MNVRLQPVRPMPVALRATRPGSVCFLGPAFPVGATKRPTPCRLFVFLFSAAASKAEKSRSGRQTHGTRSAFSSAYREARRCWRGAWSSRVAPSLSPLVEGVRQDPSNRAGQCTGSRVSAIRPHVEQRKLIRPSSRSFPRSTPSTQSSPPLTRRKEQARPPHEQCHIDSPLEAVSLVILSTSHPTPNTFLNVELDSVHLQTVDQALRGYPWKDGGGPSALDAAPPDDGGSPGVLRSYRTSTQTNNPKGCPQPSPNEPQNARLARPKAPEKKLRA